jgi:hypothetical protein
VSDHGRGQPFRRFPPDFNSLPPPDGPTWVDTVLAIICLAALFSLALKSLFWLYFADTSGSNLTFESLMGFPFGFGRENLGDARRKIPFGFARGYASAESPG